MKQNKLLDGVTVLDLTRVVAGPSCTRALADLGAEVIKIEPPEGDLWRRGQPRRGGVSVGFTQLNAGKRFVSIDMSDQRGRILVFDLALQADVVVENFRPGVAARLGMGFPDVRAANPDVIYCSISGYGQTGNSAHRRAYAPIIHAEFGLLHENAREWGSEPRPESVSHVDFEVGNQAAIGILAALFNRERTGDGQYIEASMAETMLAMNEATAIEVNGGVGELMSPFRPAKAAVVRVANGDWAQLPGNPANQVFQIGQVLGCLDDVHKRGFNSPQEIWGHEDVAVELLRSWSEKFESVAALEHALDSIKVPVGRINPLADSITTDWAKERGAFIDVDCGTERISIPMSPLRFDRSAVGPDGGAFHQGVDNRSVLSEKLHLDDETMNALQADGVLIEYRLTD